MSLLEVGLYEFSTYNLVCKKFVSVNKYINKSFTIKVIQQKTKSHQLQMT
jgi:hypothetical protein